MSARGTIGSAFATIATAIAASLVVGCPLNVQRADGVDRHDLDQASAPAQVSADSAKLLAAASYPAAGVVTRGGPLPDLSFDGVTESGARGTIYLHDYFTPHAASPRLLVVRVHGGAWCGTCLWHAKHTGEIAALPVAGRVAMLDLVVGDRDNAPARAEDAVTWRALLDSPSSAPFESPNDVATAPSGFKIAVGADPAFSLRGILGEDKTPLPLYVFVDPRTMMVKAWESNPDPYELRHQIERQVAALDGVQAVAQPAETLVDGIFHRNEWDMLKETALVAAPPSDPTNAVADDPAAAALGKELFEDRGLSSSGAVACSTCHDKNKLLSDGLAQSQGVAKGSRRTPQIALAAHARWQFWEGRADTLWAQALGPLENPTEMAGSRSRVARRMQNTHTSAYAKAFPGSPLPDLALLPAEGKPGDASYERLREADKAAITRVFVNAGKAIAAYERTFRVRENRLDAYVGGDFSALTPVEKGGLSMFMQVGCMQCHWGPRLTDDAFHATRAPTGRADGAGDRGRIDGIALFAESEFRATSRWSDDRSRGSQIGDDARDSAPVSKAQIVATPSMLGAFKTPSLRGVARATKLGHGGALSAPVDVVQSYGKGGLPETDARAVGQVEPWLPRFGEVTQWGIAPFLGTLTADPVVP